MRDSRRLEEELERAEVVYDGLVRTRRSLGTTLAETIRKEKDLEEFGRHLRDLPLLIQQADLRRTELRYELSDRLARRAEKEYRRAAEEAGKAARALEQARRAYVEAEDTARSSELEARRLAAQRDNVAEHLQELRQVPEDAQRHQGDYQQEQGEKPEELREHGAQDQRQQSEERTHDPSQVDDGDGQGASGAGSAGEDANRRSAE